MKKAFISLLALLLVLPLAVSCASNRTEETTPETTPAVQEGATSAELTGDTAAALNIPDTVKFGGTEISILYWKDVERPEFYIEDENGEKVNDALYTKNLRTEEMLDVKFVWEGEKGNFDNQTVFVNKAYNGANSGTPYDIHCCYSLAASTLTTRGLTENLGAYEQYLDFTKPWWPKTLIDAVTIHDKIYFCSGDISSNMLYFMYGCFFNKEIYESVHSGEEMPYEIAVRGEWTIDKLIELSQGVYEDADGDGTRSYDDKYGFMTIDLHFDCFYAAAGLKTIVRDANGDLVASEDLSSDKAYDLLSKLTSFFTTSGDAFAKGTTKTFSSSTAFSKGMVLFTVDRVYLPTFSTMKASDVKYGILPVPKYDKDQESYITCMAFPYTIYSVASFSNHKEEAAAVLQVLAYNSYDLVTPALFYETMKLRYSSESMDSIMYDYIRGGVYIDIGRIFSTPLSDVTYSIWRSGVKRMDVTTWSSALNSGLSTLSKRLDKLNKELKKLN